jgi:hypothetical protein
VKYWSYIIVFLLGAALAFFLLKGCSKPPSHQKDKNSVDSLLKVNAEEQRQVTILKVKFTSDSIHLRRKIDSITALHNLTRIRLDNKTKENNALVDMYNASKYNRDTAQTALICDTLSIAVKAQSHIISAYEFITDSLISAHKQYAVAQDSMLTRVNKAYFNSQMATRSIGFKYDTLATDYSKLSKTNSLNSTLWKIGGIVILADIIKGILSGKF